ncbi:YrzI family small protein, partial [Bacillus toyonensis]
LSQNEVLHDQHVQTTMDEVKELQSSFYNRLF